MLEENYLCRLLAQKLPPGRYHHSLRVAEVSQELAARFSLSVPKARTAALLHDYARDLPPGELVALARKGGLIQNPLEERAPVLLHGPVGAWLIERDLGVIDPEILEAVACHTVGRPGMGPLARLIYLADAIEPGRDYPGVSSLRELAKKDLDAALAEAFKASILYILSKRQLLHPLTVEAWNYLLLERGDGSN
ncbi:MAG: hypothetical protein PWP65_856 [Clostridia bacterium]|nr:hypothetical protein [Clostridia bacterium]